MLRKVLKNLWEAWKRLAHKIGRVQTVILLTLFYFIIIVPLGSVFLLFGWDPLKTRRHNLEGDSNWLPVERGEPDLDAMRRQS